jgi:peptidyl-dipeptidase A
MYRLATVLALLTAVCTFTGCHEPAMPEIVLQQRATNDAERECLRLYEQYAARYEPLYIERELASWQAETTGTDAAFKREADAEDALNNLHSDRQVFATIKSLRAGGKVRDPVLARLLDVMYRSFLPAQVDPDIQRKIVVLQTEAVQIFNTHRGSLNGKPVTENDVRDILAHTTDSALAEQAWKAYMDVGAEVRPQLDMLVKLRNEQARSVGFSNFYDMNLALNEIDKDEMFALFDKLDELTRPEFVRLKAEIDAARAAHFGIPVKQLRPWHYGDLFFQESPPIQPVDLDAIYRDRDLLALARTYYDSIGLPVEDILARSDLYEKSGKSPHAFSVDIDRAGDVRILCNLRPTLMWADTVLHELGHAVYDEHIRRDLPFAMRTPSAALTTEGVALMFGAMSKNEDFLVRVVGLDPDRDAETIKAARDALRLEKIVFSRWAQVMVRFEYGMYSNPNQDLSKLWYDLRQRYQLINPPDEPGRPDYGAKYHIVTTPAYYHSYMLGDLFASQLQVYLAREIARTDKPLSTCFFGRKEAGDYLRDAVFGPGALYPWNELTRRATGEPLTARYFAEMYVK